MESETSEAGLQGSNRAHVFGMDGALAELPCSWIKT